MRTATIDEARALRSDDLLTTGEAAKLLGTSRQHVVDLCNAGLLPFAYAGKTHRRVRRGDIEALRRSSNDELSRDQQRSLWLAYATAAHVVRDPDRARRIGLRNVEKMRPNARGQARLWLEEWHELLGGPITELLEAYTSPNLHGRELRQHSPFAGLLTASERTAVLRAWKASQSQTSIR